MSVKPKIRIAIIGGGLGGTALARALVRLPNLDVHIYEGDATFSERGASIGLANNAQRALAAIDPDDPDMLKRAGAVAQDSMQMIMGSGPQAKTLISSLHIPSREVERLPRVSVHRASLLRELEGRLPEERKHTSKKLVSLKSDHESGGVEVVFEDGESATFDAVIGADGLWSVVRHHVLGDAAAMNEPTNAGWWDCRNMLPYERAKEILGAEWFETDRAYGWPGEGGFILHTVLENRQKVMCVASVLEKDPPQDARRRPLTRDILTEAFGAWADGPIGNRMIEFMTSEEPSQPKAEQRFALYEHKTTPTYANGAVCIVGDAAHAATPWQGAGGGQAFEDAIILGALLSCVSSASEVPQAFQVYDEVRRPRAQRILESSRESGLILCGADPTVGLDVEKMRGELGARAALVEDFDLIGYKRDAVRTLERALEV